MQSALEPEVTKLDQVPITSNLGSPRDLCDDLSGVLDTIQEMFLDQGLNHLFALLVQLGQEGHTERFVHGPPQPISRHDLANKLERTCQSSHREVWSLTSAISQLVSIAQCLDS